MTEIEHNTNRAMLEQPTVFQGPSWNTAFKHIFKILNMTLSTPRESLQDHFKSILNDNNLCYKQRLKGVGKQHQRQDEKRSD